MIEYASDLRGNEAWRNAPPEIRAKLEANHRRLYGLDHEPETRFEITYSPDSPARPGAPMTRVFLVVAHGDARAEHIGMPRSETLTRGAFGDAATLNSELGWSLNMGHKGPVLSYNGERRGLVAHDSEIGIVLEWHPRMDDPANRDAVEKIERGWGCSVQYSYFRRHITEIPSLRLGIVRRGRLLHVAIVERPAYAGSVAMVFRDSRRGDRDQVREQLDKVVRQAKFAERRSRGWV